MSLNTIYHIDVCCELNFVILAVSPIFGKASLDIVHAVGGTTWSLSVCMLEGGHSIGQMHQV